MLRGTTVRLAASGNAVAGYNSARRSAGETRKQWLFRVYARGLCGRAVWKVFSGGLRILSYHGVCQDEIAHEPGIPAYFVTRSAFEQQLQYLVQHVQLLKLSEAVHLLAANRLPARATAITFDDGYANNFHVALPLLKTYSVPATIFAATGCVRSGEFFPFDKVRLVHLLQGAKGDDSDYYRLPLDRIEQLYAPRWNALRSSLPVGIYEALRPLTLNELQQLPKDLIELGAHTRSHCYLPHEAPERRRFEIIASLRDVSEWTGNPAPLFAYPNGAFDEFDKQMLDCHVPAAVTTVAGRNFRETNLLELKRYPVTSGHDLDAFVAEVTGLRTWLLRLRRSSASGAAAS